MAIVTTYLKRWEDNIFRVAATGKPAISVTKIVGMPFTDTLIARDRYVDI